MQHMTMSYGHRELRLFSCVIMASNALLFSICGADMMSLYAVRNSNGLSLRVNHNIFSTVFPHIVSALE